MKYFIYDPNFKEPEFFATDAEWMAAMDDFDFSGRYADDGWDEEVENVCAGIIPDGIVRNENEEEECDFYSRYATHTAQQHNRKERPDDIDEEGYSPSQDTYWNDDYDFICEYQFAEIKKAEAA